MLTRLMVWFLIGMFIAAMLVAAPVALLLLLIGVFLVKALA